MDDRAAISGDRKDRPVESFWTIARADPARVAIVSARAGLVTAGDLLTSSNQLVYALREALGLQVGAVLAVVMQSSVPFLEIVMAATQAGFYVTPINTRLTAAEMAYVLENSGASVLFCDGESAEVVSRAVEMAKLPLERCFISTETTAANQTLDSLKLGKPASDPENRLLGGMLFYTSGTTGQPKAVKRPLPNTPPDATSAATSRLRLRSVGIRPADECVHLVVAPLYHSAALAWCTAHLHFGHTVVLMDEDGGGNSWNPETMLDRIQKHRVTGTLMVPTHFTRLLALPDEVKRRYDVSSLRHVVHGGAPCRVDVKQRMMDWWGPVIHEVYGAAEATGGTYVSPQEWLARPGTVGKARGQIKILREKDGMEECDPREVGAVYFDSGGKHFEYAGDPEKTKASRHGDLFTVGDLGYLDEDGYLFLSDRKSDVIISGGVNVYPAEVEAALATHPKVADVAVIGIPDDEWGEQVKAIVELFATTPATDPSPELAQEIIAHCREKIAAFKCPRSVDFVSMLPRDPNGKLYKRHLRDPYWVGRDRKI